MPSSAIRTLPSPSTSVFLSLFVTLLPVKLPSAYDRGDGAAALNVIVIKGKIHVHDDKSDKEPEQQVMPEAHAKLAAHQQDDPHKHARQPRIAHAGIKRKPGDGLGHECQESKEVDKCRQRIVARRNGAVQLGLQHVGLDHIHNLLPLRLFQREEVVPLGVFIASTPNWSLYAHGEEYLSLLVESRASCPVGRARRPSLHCKSSKLGSDSIARKRTEIGRAHV